MVYLKAIFWSMEQLSIYDQLIFICVVGNDDWLLFAGCWSLVGALEFFPFVHSLYPRKRTQGFVRVLLAVIVNIQMVLYVMYQIIFAWDWC